MISLPTTLFSLEKMKRKEIKLFVEQNSDISFNCVTKKDCITTVGDILSLVIFKHSLDFIRRAYPKTYKTVNYKPFSNKIWWWKISRMNAIAILLIDKLKQCESVIECLIFPLKLNEKVRRKKKSFEKQSYLSHRQVMRMTFRLVCRLSTIERDVIQ